MLIIIRLLSVRIEIEESMRCADGYSEWFSNAIVNGLRC